jgi:hypothetical protein
MRVPEEIVMVSGFISTHRTPINIIAHARAGRKAPPIGIEVSGLPTNHELQLCLKSNVKLRVPVALGFIVMTGCSAWSQPGSLSLCIVHTKSHSSDQYEPSAGPDAIAMYQELAGRRLQNGATLQITVLPASMQQEIEPEVHRLNCSWVLQLWYRRADEDAFGQVQPRGAHFNSVLFILWSSTTREVIEKGAGFVSLATKPPLTPFASFRKQILKKLNRLP